jgi:hypothetical protein
MMWIWKIIKRRAFKFVVVAGESTSTDLWFNPTGLLHLIIELTIVSKNIRAIENKNLWKEFP